MCHLCLLYFAAFATDNPFHLVKFVCDIQPWLNEVDADRLRQMVIKKHLITEFLFLYVCVVPTFSDESLNQQLSDMTAWESKVFRELRPDLVSTLTPGDMRLQCECTQLITRAQRELFAPNTDRAAQNEKLLDALSKGDDESFHIFLECIREVEPPASARRLLAKLEPIDKLYSPSTKG